MLHKDFSEMDESVWQSYPATTSAVERKNKDSHGKSALPLQSALINLYKLDKAAWHCDKHIAASEDVSTTYSDKSETARRAAAATRSKQRACKYPNDVAQYMAHLTANATLTGSQLRGKCVAIIIIMRFIP